MEFNKNKKLGIALVGLGKYSTEELAPSLLQTEHCYLAGIVTGSPEKAEKWQDQYNIPGKNTYNYHNFDSIKDNSEIDIVYIVLPNTMHAEFTIRAAKAGKHVICEKPMAMNAEECEQMIQACKSAGCLLSIGYRLHFDAHNKQMMRLGKEELIGKIVSIKANNGREIQPGTWRTDKELGGSPLRDMGIYCIQACLYTFGQNPVSVTAIEPEKTDKKLFSETEEAINWHFEFPGGATADCWASYSEKYDMLKVETENGTFGLEPAFYYDGLQGYVNQDEMKLRNSKKQQALQMDDFALCILENKPTRVPGEMGLRDIKIVNAIFESAKLKTKVYLQL